MKKIKSTTQLIFLLSLFCIDSIKPAAAAASYLEKSANPEIIKSYALKRMLTAIMKIYPDSPVQKAILLSPLIAQIDKDWALNSYGAFTLIPDPDAKQQGRLKKEFSTATPLNQLARELFNVTDGIIEPTKQPSNPFFGLDSKTVARMMQTIHTNGILELARMLQEQIKEKPHTTASADTTVKRWYDTYRTLAKSGKLPELRRFKKALNQKFIPLLIALDREAITPENKERNVEDLSKLLMTYVFLKDLHEGSSNPSYSTVEYFQALGASDFKADYETKKELEELDNFFKETVSSFSLKPNDQGIEKIAFYLNDKIYASTEALQTPYAVFKSTPTSDPTNRFDGKEFIYCAEATVRSIINLILYDPATGKLNIQLLSALTQQSMNPEVKSFFQENNAPSIPNYYRDTEVKWLHLMSGIEGVIYKKNPAQGGFEISGMPGPKNILTILNHIFGIKTESLETLGIALSQIDTNRTITFTATASGYHLSVSDKTGPIVQGILNSQENIEHTAFIVSNNGFLDLLATKQFIPIVKKVNTFLNEGQDLFRICFNNTTMHLTQYNDQLNPLEFVLKNGLTEVLKTLLHYETKLINYDELLRKAATYSNYPEIVDFLLSHVINPNFEELLDRAVMNGNTETAALFLSHVPNPNWQNLLDSALSRTPALFLYKTREEEELQFYRTIKLLLSKGTIVSQKNIEDAITNNNELDIIQLLLSHFTAEPNHNRFLEAAIQIASPLFIEFFLEKEAKIEDDTLSLLDFTLSDANRYYPKLKRDLFSVVKTLIQKKAIITTKNVIDSIKRGQVEVIALLLGHHPGAKESMGELLEKAIKEKSPKIVELLINEGALLNEPIIRKKTAESFEYITALTAALNEPLESEAIFALVNFLINHGAIITKKNLEQSQRNSKLLELLERKQIEDLEPI